MLKDRDGTRGVEEPVRDLVERIDGRGEQPVRGRRRSAGTEDAAKAAQQAVQRHLRKLDLRSGLRSWSKKKSGRGSAQDDTGAADRGRRRHQRTRAPRTGTSLAGDFV